MRIFTLVAVCAALAPFGYSQNIERSARPIFDTTRELQAMQLVPRCAPGTPVVVSGTRFVCGNASSVMPNCAPGVPVTVSGSALVCSPVPTCSTGRTLNGSDGRFACCEVQTQTINGFDCNVTPWSTPAACPAGFTDMGVGRGPQCGTTHTNQYPMYRNIRTCRRVVCD